MTELVWDTPWALTFFKKFPQKDSDVQNNLREREGEWAREIRLPGSTKDSLRPLTLQRKRPVNTVVCSSLGRCRNRENETELWLGFCLVTKPGRREQVNYACMPGRPWNLAG